MTGARLRMVALALFAVSACTKANLERWPPNRGLTRDDKLEVQGRLCTRTPESLVFPLRVLFVVDCSESMKVTDPAGPGHRHHRPRAGGASGVAEPARPGEPGRPGGHHPLQRPGPVPDPGGPERRQGRRHLLHRRPRPARRRHHCPRPDRPHHQLHQRALRELLRAAHRDAPGRPGLAAALQVRRDLHLRRPARHRHHPGQRQHHHQHPLGGQAAQGSRQALPRGELQLPHRLSLRGPEHRGEPAGRGPAPADGQGRGQAPTAASPAASP